MRCRMSRDDVRCEQHGLERVFRVPGALAGAQDKMVVRMVVLCDRCWTDWQRARIYRKAGSETAS